MSKKKEDKIYTMLSSIDETLKRQNSPRRIFFQGVLRGLGTALGATILVALATSIAVQLVDVLNWDMFSQFFFNEVVTE